MTTSTLTDITLAVARIDVRDLDRNHIDQEHHDRVDGNNNPHVLELPYYMHTGHRVHLTFRNPDGEAVNFDATDTNLTAVRAIEEEVNAAIRATGATAETGWVFSAYAGCGMCYCSPGFLVDGTGPERQVFVDVTVNS